METWSRPPTVPLGRPIPAWYHHPFQLTYGVKQHSVAMEERYYGPRWLHHDDNDDDDVAASNYSEQSFRPDDMTVEAQCMNSPDSR